MITNLKGLETALRDKERGQGKRTGCYLGLYQDSTNWMLLLLHHKTLLKKPLIAKRMGITEIMGWDGRYREVCGSKPPSVLGMMWADGVCVCCRAGDIVTTAIIQDEVQGEDLLWQRADDEMAFSSVPFSFLGQLLNGCDFCLCPSAHWGLWVEQDIC